MRLVFSLSLSLLLLILMATAFQNCTRMQPFSGTGDSSTGVFLPTFDAEGGGGDGVIIDNEIIDYYSCTPMENSNTANFSVLRNNTTNEYIVSDCKGRLWIPIPTWGFRWTSPPATRQKTKRELCFKTFDGSIWQKTIFVKRGFRSAWHTQILHG